MSGAENGRLRGDAAIQMETGFQFQNSRSRGEFKELHSEGHLRVLTSYYLRLFYQSPILF